MVACLALTVFGCSSAHNAFWRFTVLVLGSSGVRRLLAPGRGGVLALGVSDSRLSLAPMALSAPPLNDRLAAHFSARQPGHSAILRCSMLFDCLSGWPRIGRSAVLAPALDHSGATPSVFFVFILHACSCLWCCIFGGCCLLLCWLSCHRLRWRVH